MCSKKYHFIIELAHGREQRDGCHSKRAQHLRHKEPIQRPNKQCLAFHEGFLIRDFLGEKEMGKFKQK